MSGIFKRSHDLAKAQAKSRFEAPSTIESIVQMRKQLATKQTSLETLYHRVQNEYNNHRSLMVEWKMRENAASETLANLPDGSPNHANVEHLLRVATNHYEINVEGEHETRKKLDALAVSLRKIQETVEGLRAAENRYELNASITRASEAVGERRQDFAEDEAEVVKRLAYSANALLDLKEKDLMLPEVKTNIKSITMEKDFNELEGA